MDMPTERESGTEGAPRIFFVHFSRPGKEYVMGSDCLDNVHSTNIGKQKNSPHPPLAPFLFFRQFLWKILGSPKKTLEYFPGF
jgi:hypothetical protein